MIIFTLHPTDDSTEQTRRRNLIDNLHLEVARIQPTPTSAHRRPRINIPDELQRSSHVFVQQGGVQPSLSTPYVGPYRVVSRQQDSFRVAIPGAPTESINIARLRPAIMPSDDNVDPPQDPPTPPRPGRRPRPPSNPPPASDRRTRSAPPAPPANPTHDQDPPNYDPGQGTSAQARARTRSPSPDEEDDYLSKLRRLQNWPTDSDSDSNDEQENHEPPVTVPSPPARNLPPTESSDPTPGHVPADENLAAYPCDPPSGPCQNPKFDPPRRFTTPRERTFSDRGGQVPRQAFRDNSKPHQRTRFFTKPQERKFSKRPNVSYAASLAAIMADHLKLKSSNINQVKSSQNFQSP